MSIRKYQAWGNMVGNSVNMECEIGQVGGWGRRDVAEY